MATPTLVGSPPSASDAPVIDISPLGGLDDEVVAGPVGGRAVRPVARDGQVDEPRVERVAASSSSKPSRANPPTRKFSTRTSPRSSSRRRTATAVGLLEVEPDAALVPVDRQVVGRGPGLAGRRGRADPRRAPAARRVAVGRLDLDDVGAEVGQQHRAVRPGQDRRAIDDAQAGQRARARDRAGGIVDRW